MTKILRLYDSHTFGSCVRAASNIACPLHTLTPREHIRTVFIVHSHWLEQAHHFVCLLPFMLFTLILFFLSLHRITVNVHVCMYAPFFFAVQRTLSNWPLEN